MANNRIFIIHQPSGLGVLLGKRLSEGFYKPVAASELQRFYNHTAGLIDDGSGIALDPDDLILYHEDGVNETVDWVCTAEFESGFRVFRLMYTGDIGDPNLNNWSTPGMGGRAPSAIAEPAHLKAQHVRSGEARRVLDKVCHDMGWCGEGLPSAGVVCDILWNHGLARGSQITYISNEVGCYLFEGKEYTFATRDVEFRYIPSERDIQIDAMCKVMEMKNGSPSKLYTGYARSLYDAGYRKLEGKE